MPDLTLSAADLQQLALITSLMFLAVALSVGRRILADEVQRYATRKQAALARARCALETKDTDEDTGNATEIANLVEELIYRNRWGSLAKIMQHSAGRKVNCGTGDRLSHAIVHAALGPVSHACERVSDRPAFDEKSVAMLDHALAPFRFAAEESDGTPELCALAALGAIEAAWASHGAFAGREPSEAGTAAFADYMAEAARWVAHADPDAPPSVYLAEARYGASFASENPAGTMADAFTDWVAIDRSDIRPYTVRAIHLMPGWYGDFALIGDLAKQAVRATSSEYGEAAFAHIVAALDPFIDPSQIPGYSPERIAHAVIDAVSRVGTQAAANYWTSWALTHGLEDLAQVLMRRFMREIQLDQWDPHDDHAEVYALYLRAFAGRRPKTSEEDALPAAA